MTKINKKGRDWPIFLKKDLTFWLFHLFFLSEFRTLALFDSSLIFGRKTFSVTGDQSRGSCNDKYVQRRDGNKEF